MVSVKFVKLSNKFFIFFPQIEDLSQQAQVAAAEKFKAPDISQSTETGATTVSFFF